MMRGPNLTTYLRFESRKVTRNFALAFSLKYLRAVVNATGLVGNNFIFY